MNFSKIHAPGWPGMDARWSPGPKSSVGTALSDDSSVWFTTGHGILNEVYYPRVDTPSIRDLGFIITGEDGYFSEEKEAVKSHVAWPVQGVPAIELTNESRDGRYKITKHIITDPKRPTVLQKIDFEAAGQELKLYALLAPHLGNQGGGNTAWIGQFNGQTVLQAQRGDCCLALVCSVPFGEASAGYVGSSDGWQELKNNGRLEQQYGRAENGNTALCAEIQSPGGTFVIALSFGDTPQKALGNALASLQDGFQAAWDGYVTGWQGWLQENSDSLPDGSAHPATGSLAEVSLAVLKSHGTKKPDGGLVAGLASPWGYSKSDADQIGYHVIWTRDMVEAAGGLLAAGAHSSIKPMLRFLSGVQQPDGHWPQNMWQDGTPHWNGVQMDETALPIVLINLAHREGALSDEDLAEFWPMAKKAASFVVRGGPVTQQDRWEEDPGYTPFTVAAEIAGLLAAADIADMQQEPAIAAYLRQTADTWHDSLDTWLYARDTHWCRRYDVEGYYERISLTGQDEVSRFQNNIHVKNVPAEDANMPAVHLVSVDALALVRFGLRTADDPRIRNTVKLIDELLKADTPNGPTWHRYNDDGYGENTDGSAFDGTGVGRGWPLLTGERAHYELAAGHHESAAVLRQSMERFTGEGNLLPEQVWDSKDIPEHELYLGAPSGSAMPLAWAHAEYLKLLRSERDGRIFDLPPQTVKRYLEDQIVSPLKSWRFNHKLRRLPAGKILRVETLAPARVRWSTDAWATFTDSSTEDVGLGIFAVDLDTADLQSGSGVVFTFFWPEAGHWEGRNFSVNVD